MKINFYHKNIEITAGVRQKMEKKINHLEKYSKTLDILNVRVDISRDRHHNKGDVFRVEINVDIPKHLLRAVEQAHDPLAACDLAMEKLERQARKAKEKEIDKKKH